MLGGPSLYRNHHHSTPPATALLSIIFSSLLEHASAAALVTNVDPINTSKTLAAVPGPLSLPAATPFATTSISYRALNVQSWPLVTDESSALATMILEEAASPADLHRRLARARAATFNTICGYIGGNPQLPATCLAGSHCVLDSEHSAVGCCPNDAETCTSGVFTGCVDSNGGLGATEVNPYVYTCSAGSVCYKNTFPGGYFQYGCGSASTMGQSVAVVASGKPALIIGSERVSFTGTQTSLKKSTTSKTSLTKHSTKTTSSASLSSKTSTKSSSPTDSASSTSLSSHSPSTEAPGLADPGNETNTSSRASNGAGVIIGATISGIAGLIALIAVVVFFCCKRGRGAASRNGSASVRSASGNFQPLRSNPDDYESAPSPDMALAGNHRSLFTRISAGGPFSPHLQPGDGRNTYHRGGENDFDAWPVAAVAPTSTAHTTDADATVRAASVAPSRRGSVGTSSILSCDGSKRHSYRGVVTNAVAVGAGCNTMGSLLSHTASKKAVYTQISQQSPYDDTFANSPYNNDSSVSTADSVHNSRNDDEDGNRLHPDHVPLSRDFDEYVRGHTDTLDRICEEDDTDGPSSSANQLPSAAVEDVCLPDTNRCDCTPKVDEDCSNSSSSLIEPASAFDDSTLSGTKRGSSGVLPIDQHMHSNQLQSSLGLRGGDSSGSGSPEVGEPSSSTKASIAAGHSIVGVVGHRGSVIDCCDDRPALHLTTPLLPLDVDSVRPPAVVLVNGDDALPPPVSPPMRPLWQQNRQKSRKLRS